MIELGGVRFRIRPEDALSPAEQELLASLGARTSPPPDGEAASAAFDLELRRLAAPAAEGSPAEVRADGDRVRIVHAAFDADIDPWRAAGRLARLPGSRYPLALTLRVALASRLPAVGGLPLHAAGLRRHESGLVFFGPSGAGKSTLAARSPDTLLSDELVAVVPAGGSWTVAATGVWGSLGDRGAPQDRPPLAALVELAQGPRFELTRLDPKHALRRLLAATLVPPSPRLWTAALAVLARLASCMPVHRMAWSPETPPWPALDAALGLARPATPRAGPASVR